MDPRFPDPQVDRWLAENTLGPSEFAPAELAEEKRSQGLRISVCIPALNEAATIGTICRQVRSELMGTTALVDELVVVDSGSTDRTMDIAASEGADVHAAVDILPDARIQANGKGGALWKSLSVTGGDIVVWLDSDIRNFSSGFVTSLVAPLLQDDGLVMAKAFYERPLEAGEQVLAGGGARVTELVVRPLLNMFAPQLSGMIQPLSGECAILRRVAMRLPFFSDYGLELGLLIDVAARCGVDSIVQVDLGTKFHNNQSVFSLGRMSHQVMQVVLRRFEDDGVLKLLEEPLPTLVQFMPDGDIVVSELKVEELPPIAEML